MPKPTTAARSETYQGLARQAMALGETNDCAVKAIAAATGADYAQVHSMLAAAGRKPGRGTQTHQMEAVLARLGFSLVYRHAQQFVARYPASHAAVLKGVTTHHPDRFASAWRDGMTYLFFTAGHVLCVKNGLNCDWTRGKARLVKIIYEVRRVVA